MNTITLPAPWATLLVTPQMEQRFNGGVGGMFPTDDMVRQWVTRPKPCSPDMIGQRILFHQSGDWPEHMNGDGWRITLDKAGLWLHIDGRNFPLPLNAIIGSGIVAESLPIEAGRHAWRIIDAEAAAAS